MRLPWSSARRGTPSNHVGEECTECKRVQGPLLRSRREIIRGRAVRDRAYSAHNCGRGLRPRAPIIPPPSRSEFLQLVKQHGVLGLISDRMDIDIADLACFIDDEDSAFGKTLRP